MLVILLTIETWIWIVAVWLPGLLLLWYIIGSISAGGAVVTSKKSSGAGSEEADLLYYLPTAALQVKATAKVLVTKMIPDGTVVAARLAGLQFDNTVLIQPDMGELYLASYTPSIFANDELRMSTTAQGLLENITVTTEDRISNIVAQLSESPGKILSLEAAGPEGLIKKEVDLSNTIDQIEEHTTTFIIPCEDLQKGSFSMPWTIFPDGPDGAKYPVDATMQFGLPESPSRVGGEKKGDGKKDDAGTHGARDDAKAVVHNGLVTRPQRKLRLAVKANIAAGDSKDPIPLFDLVVPDPSRIVVVPIKRAAFVKNQYAPKFNAGMLVESFISKPSEAEGALSIPVNILKAIFSIPAQLLSFTIRRLQQESDLETIQQKLEQQRAARKPPPQQQPQQEKPVSPVTPKPGSDQQQQLIDRLKKVGRFDTLPNDPGKAPADEVPAAKNIEAKETVLEVEGPVEAPLQAAGLTKLAAPPLISMWQGKVTGNWNSFNNQTIPNCVPAAGAHLIMSWTANALTAMKTPLEVEVQSAYKAVVESNGECKIFQFLNKWLSPGLFGETLVDYVRTPKQNIDMVKMGVHYYGGCLAGLQMPALAKNRDKWEKPAGDLTGDARPGSWGGHAVAIVGYFENFFIAVSMGELVTMSWDFYKTYNDETYILFNKTDWIIPASGLSPQGTTAAVLQNSLGSLSV